MEWKEVRLGDVCDLQEGYVNPAQTHPEYFDGPIKWVRAVDLNNANIYSTTRTLTEAGFKSAGKSALLFEPETIVISKSGTIGRLGIVKDYMCGNRAIINIKPRNPDDLPFIFYLLRNAQKDFENYAVGSVQKNLYVPILADIKFRVPSSEATQRRISSVLSSLDRKIELNNKINATLEEMAQALFKSWFVDFEPFKNGNFIDTEIGKIPEGWRVGSFRELIDILPGGTPKTTTCEYWENGTIPFFSPKDVGTSVYCFDTEKHITELGLANCNSRLYPKDTLFITARGTVGKVALAAVPMAMNQSNYALAAKEGIGKYFLYFLTKSLVAILLKKANGAVFSAITTKDFNEIIVVPSTEAISAFESKMKPIFGEIYKLSQESLTLTHLRDTLLPRLMSGEIELEDTL